MHLSSRVPTVNALPALPSMHVSSDRERVVGTTTMKSLVVVVENAECGNNNNKRGDTSSFVTRGQGGEIASPPQSPSSSSSGAGRGWQGDEEEVSPLPQPSSLSL